MRIVDYTILPCIGSGEMPMHGTVADLVLAIPYLFLSGRIPPLCVLNQVLLEGGSDAGMSGGCVWQPFQIDQSEFQEVVEYLERYGDATGQPLVYETPPPLVRTMSAWMFWALGSRK